MNSYAIQCHDLGKTFRGEPAVIDCSIDIRYGRFMALLGPSGCGKTTLLRLIAGLETPDHGSIHVGGVQVSGAGKQVPPEKRKIGMVFQEYALFPHMNVAQNVAYGLRSNGKSNGKVSETLAMVGLEHLEFRMPHELSGGQQQRVALARALAPGPEVILLDEPFSNLDASLRQRVRADLRSIVRRSGITSIFVTHDQEEALSLADFLVVMMEGEIVQAGTPRNLYLQPETHRIATFLGDANFLPAHGKGLYAECELGNLQVLNGFNGDGEIMFRPEDVIPIQDPNGKFKIVDRIYYGHDQLLYLQLPSGQIMKSRRLGSRDAYDIGQHVGIRIDTPVSIFATQFGCPALPEPESHS